MRISLKEAADLILTGKVAAVPTETVYGLAASMDKPEAIEYIYALKGRPSNNPLIVHLSEPNQILMYSTKEIPHFQRLANAFWPGPLTLVVNVDQEKIPSRIRAGLSTAAFRIPKHPLARDLIKLTGPLVMPSANLSGKPSSTRPEHIEADFGSSFPVLDGGHSSKGLESTILAYSQDQWQIVREGALSVQDFALVLGYTPMIADVPSEKPLCPGQLHRHYSPKAQLHLMKNFASDLKGVIIGFSDRTYPAMCRLISLGPLSEPKTIAENLYAILRQIDEEELQAVYVDTSFSPEGLLSTIAERLRRAAKR
jgi:L-threonylcarbamoyladenylate synthase